MVLGLFCPARLTQQGSEFYRQTPVLFSRAQRFDRKRIAVAGVADMYPKGQPIGMRGPWKTRNWSRISSSRATRIWGRLDQERLFRSPATRRELLASVFGLHTIKGTCGFLGYSKLETVAHQAGTSCRTCAPILSLTSGLASLILEAVDVMRHLAVEAGAGSRRDRATRAEVGGGCPWGTRSGPQRPGGGNGRRRAEGLGGGGRLGHRVDAAARQTRTWWAACAGKKPDLTVHRPV
jgi:hypothetical protein